MCLYGFLCHFKILFSGGVLMIDIQCLSCSCYDPDFECTMSSLDRSYCCPLFADPDESFEDLERSDE